ncbi:hypothetical protein BJY01DRAFT_219300 [Aspergillus pseudoustus]|uniref:Uncharacterized protein n=1 Tax=Aspergillus pseudoustus TaxID=1810923 RepID=A0ABR4JH38_9EURO
MILLHPDQGICQLSGTSCWYERDLDSGFLQVLWDEKATAGGAREVKLPGRMAKAQPVEIGEYHPHDELSGIVIHYRCWQLLHTHPVWTIAGSNVGVLLPALRRKEVTDREYPSGSWQTSEANIFVDEDQSFYCPCMATEHEDPFYNKRVQALIRKAKRAKHDLLPEKRHTALNDLPLEILWMKLDLLHTDEITALQRGTGRYVGDAYWRKRTNTDLFHEVRGIPEGELDWECLCRRLEKLMVKSKWAFKCRGWVLEQLGVLVSLLLIRSAG